MRFEVPIGLAMAALLGGCASEEPARRAPRATPVLAAEAPSDRAYAPGTRPVGGDDDDRDGLQIEHEKGILEQREVDRVLDRSLDTLISCYERAGATQRYVAGEVVLRFLVGRTGAVSDVLVVASDLGSYAVERCLVVEGRKLVFAAPRGRKETDFEYSLRFRSSGEMPVVDWGADVVGKEIGTLAPQLASCGALGPEPVRAVAYIEPGGAVASVGLVSEGPIDAFAGICVVEQIRRWRLPDGRGHVVRTSFPVAPPPMAAAPAPPPRPRLVKRVPRRGR